MKNMHISVRMLRELYEDIDGDLYQLTADHNQFRTSRNYPTITEQTMFRYLSGFSECRPLPRPIVEYLSQKLST